MKSRKQRWLRFSIRQLMLLVVFVATGCTALLNATTILSQSIVSLLLILLSLAVLFVIYCHGAKRAFWVGFAIIGWMYVACVGGGVPFLGFIDLENQFRRYITTVVIDYCYDELLPLVREKPAPTSIPGGGGFFSVDGAVQTGSGVADNAKPRWVYDEGQLGGPIAPAVATKPAFYPKSEDFRLVGQSFFTLMFAYLGGLLARKLRERQESEAPSSLAKAQT